ncbi:MAG TPA: hypothetical protein VM925_18655, partial [Labilithrix sp.]|nr:hypothetical protein [Labilithrix sp.]
VFGVVDLSDFEDDIAAMAQNDRWTSFTPKKPTTFDSLPVSRLHGVPVFDMWFHDATGIVARLHQHGMVVGVFTLPEKHPNAYDASGLAGAFEIQDVLTKTEMKALKKHAANVKTFGKWTREHGLEKLLGLPDVPAAPAKKKATTTPKKKAAAKKAAAKPKKKARATAARRR